MRISDWSSDVCSSDLAAKPWYFPTPEDYGARLAAAGFAVDSIELIPRPTPLPGDIAGWLETFCESFLRQVPEAGQPALLAEVTEALRGDICDAEGRWTADYVRLSFTVRLKGDRKSTRLNSSK